MTEEDKMGICRNTGKLRNQVVKGFEKDKTINPFNSKLKIYTAN